MAGTPTVSLTSAWSITASANPPRAGYVDHPLGHTAGRPGDSTGQRSIAEAALRLLESVTESGTIVPLESHWPGDWRAEARELRDHRTARHDVPQYQQPADQAAAVARHGDDVACSVCAPDVVPVD